MIIVAETEEGHKLANEILEHHEEEKRMLKELSEVDESTYKLVCEALANDNWEV